MDNRHTRAVTGLILLAVLWWTTLPEHRRQQWIMKTALALREGSRRTAVWCGWVGMDLELSGEDPHPFYDTALRLMTGPYRRADDWYRRTTGAHPL